MGAEDEQGGLSTAVWQGTAAGGGALSFDGLVGCGGEGAVAGALLCVAGIVLDCAVVVLFVVKVCGGKVGVEYRCYNTI